MEKGLRSITVPVLYMPQKQISIFRIADAKYEAQFISQVTLLPIPSLWGHPAGAAGRQGIFESGDRAVSRRRRRSPSLTIKRWFGSLFCVHRPRTTYVADRAGLSQQPPPIPGLRDVRVEFVSCDS